jgi:hypothetical protein
MGLATREVKVMPTRLIVHLAVYLGACATTLSGSPVAAATVFPYAGDVFVSQGKGFHKIDGPTTVKAGDSVLVSLNGLAHVQLDDGTAFTVSPGVVFAVPAKARAKDAALPDGASPTQANAGSSDGVNGLIAAGVLVGAAAGGAAALANSGGGGAPLIVAPGAIDPSPFIGASNPASP